MINDFFVKLSLTSKKKDTSVWSWNLMKHFLALGAVREPWLCAICLQGSASTVASLAGVIVNLLGYVGLDGEPMESCQLALV